jgi:uncharacterized protein
MNGCCTFSQSFIDTDTQRRITVRKWAPPISYLMYNRAYSLAVAYEWDPNKARTNLVKHGVLFADAVAVLEDDYALTMRDRYLEEERWITLGSDALGRVLVLVCTWRGDDIRLITARFATPRERRKYEEGP